MAMSIASSYHIPVPDLSRSGVSLLAVTVTASTGKGRPLIYSAYQALVKFEASADLGNDAYLKERERLCQAVADRGAKLSFKQAKVYFPALSEEIYVK